MQDNSVPLGYANINYQSATSDMPSSTPIQGPSSKSATKTQGSSNSGWFLSGALSNLSSLCSCGTWKETWK